MDKRFESKMTTAPSDALEKRKQGFLWKETVYKQFFMEETEEGQRLRIQLKNVNIPPVELRGAIQKLKADTEKYELEKMVAQFEPSESTDAPEFYEEYVEGTEFGANAYDYEEEVDNLNEFILKSIKMADKEGYCFDIRQPNFISEGYGDIKMVDLFPVISKKPCLLSNQVGRDPYGCILEQTQGTLNSKNLLALAKRADLPERVKDYWAIVAQDRKAGERARKKERPKFTHEQLKAVAQELVEILNESEVVKQAGIFGSMSRFSKHVNDIDLVAVVNQETFIKAVSHLKQESFRRKNIRSVFYLPLTKMYEFLKLTDRQMGRIAQKKKIKVEQVEKVIGTHLILLPEKLNDKDVLESLTWLIQNQPDAQFFLNMLWDAMTNLDTQQYMVDSLGKEFYEAVVQITQREIDRREKVREEVEKELEKDNSEKGGPSPWNSAID